MLQWGQVIYVPESMLLLYVTVTGTVHWIYNGKEDESLVKFMGKRTRHFHIFFSTKKR
jgi:hypothetical protein